jgi:hypothetical protein
VTTKSSSKLSSSASLSLSSDVEEINTKELAQRISAELKRYSIPQAIFAQRVLCRSQVSPDLSRAWNQWGIYGVVLGYALGPAEEPEAVVEVEVGPGDVQTNGKVAAGARVPADVGTAIGR